MTGGRLHLLITLGATFSVVLALPIASAAPGDVAHLQDWESGAAGWTAQSGYTLDIVADPDATHGQVQHVTETGGAGDFFSPEFAVQESTTYCLMTWIRWDGGGWPFVGIQWDGGPAHNWLIGLTGVSSGSLGGTVTPVPDDVSGWAWYTREFTSLSGVDTAQIIDEAANGWSKAGETSVYFDDLALVEGGCPDTPPFPVPELGTFVLVSVGLLGMAAMVVARRR